MNRRGYLRTVVFTGATATSGCSGLYGQNLRSHSEAEKTGTLNAPSKRSGRTLSGIYNGWGPPETGVLNRWLGHKPSVVMVFVDAFTGESWIKTFIETRMTTIWERGHVPMLTWQPLISPREDTPEDIEIRIANGAFDDAITTWANRLESWVFPRPVNKSPGRRFYFRLGNEMNGNWFPWSATSTESEETSTKKTESPEDYTRMWRHIHGIFSNSAMDESNIQWVWNPTVNSNTRVERYYPGDDYVDWIGLSGFNYGDTQSSSNWLPPKELFGTMTEQMQELADKPLAFPEIASSSYVNGAFRPKRKEKWIEQVYSFVNDHGIKMTCWYNFDDTGEWESDWAVFGGVHGTSTYHAAERNYLVYDAYRRETSKSSMLNARTDYPRVLTDDEFAGRW